MTENPCQKGFTLIELMITVAIVGILASIAYPSYQEHVLKSWRANATGCLLELANRMERRYTGASSYEGEEPPDAGCRQESGMNDRYDFDFVDDPTATTFQLKATPKGVQANDKCGTLTINHWGQKNVVDAASGYDAAICWRR